jgi:adenylate kinase
LNGEGAKAIERTADRRFALVLFGPPGSGKGTQAKMLMAATGYPHISTGDMLRERIKNEDGLGRLIQAILRSGQLVTDELVNRMVEERIGQPDCTSGFILDGYPRTLPQAESMHWLLAGRGLGHLVVHLKVDYNRLVARLTARRQCPQCGTLYNLLARAPMVAGRCDIEGAQLVVREDDSEPVIRKRLEGYEEQTRPLIEYFRKEGSLREVEASDGSPCEIAAEIRSIVEEFREWGGKAA